MKNALPVLFFCINLVCIGQEQPPSEKGWMLGVGVSPDIAYRTLQDTGEPYSSLVIADRNGMETPRMAYSAGFYANYMFNKRFGIGTGMIYSVKGYEVSKHWVSFLDDIRTFMYMEPHHRMGEYAFHYIDIPFTAIITIGEGRLRSITNIGFSGNLLWAGHYSFTSEYEDGRTYSWRSPVGKPFKVVDLSGVFSTGIGYRMNHKLDLRLEPNFRHALLSSRRSSYATNLFWNAGINVSAFLDLR